MAEHQAVPEAYSILVAVDYSEGSTLALAEAIRIATQRAPSHLHFVRVLAGVQLGGADAGSAPGVTSAVSTQEPQGAAQELQDYLIRLVGSPNDPGAPATLAEVSWTAHVRSAEPVQAIAQLATDLQVQLVVVGTHSRKGLARFLLGSVAEGVVRHAPCPVLVVREVGAQPANDVPQIEPACERCVAQRRATAGKQLWCEQHSAHHDRRHTYHFSPFRSSHQSGLL